MRYSPAPWRIEDGFGPIAILDANENRVADLSGPHDRENARLIVHMPDMIDKTQALLAKLSKREPHQEEYDDLARFLYNMTGDKEFLQYDTLPAPPVDEE